MNEILGTFLKKSDERAYKDYMELKFNTSKLGDKAMVEIAGEIIKRKLIEVYNFNSSNRQSKIERKTLKKIMDINLECHFISKKEYEVIDAIRNIRNIFAHANELFYFDDNTEVLKIINETEVLDESILFEDQMAYDSHGNVISQSLVKIHKDEINPRSLFDRIIIDIYFRLFIRKNFSKKYFRKDIPMYGVNLGILNDNFS